METDEFAGIERPCVKCGVVKALADFPPGKAYKYGRMTECRDCRTAYYREKRKSPEYRAVDDARRKVWHQTKYKFARYGITEAQYTEMFESQGKRCAMCETDTPNVRQDWCIDHCHKTGRVRGILCHACNMALGHYEKVLDTLGLDKINRYLIR